jgi:hypothetical protein
LAVEADLGDMFKEASKSVCVLLLWYLLTSSPTPSTSSVMKTDPQRPGRSASLLETEQTPESTEGDLDAPEPAAERDIQIGYTSD